MGSQRVHKYRIPEMHPPCLALVEDNNAQSKLAGDVHTVIIMGVEMC